MAGDGRPERSHDFGTALGKLNLNERLMKKQSGCNKSSNIKLTAFWNDQICQKNVKKTKMKNKKVTPSTKINK